MAGSNIAKLAAAGLLTLTLAASSMGIAGCGPRKEEPQGKVSTKPGEDRLRTKNEDTLYGKLVATSFTLTSPYFAKLTLPKADVHEISFENGQDTITTVRGDVLRGQLSADRFRFEARVGVTRDFKRSELQWIRLGHD